MANEEGANANEQLRRLLALKREHGPLLMTIVEDPGMSVETRRQLVAHLVEEEDEAVARVGAALEHGGAPAAAPASSPGAPRRSVTVGSLRPEHLTPASERPNPTTLGSLRRS